MKSEKKRPSSRAQRGFRTPDSHSRYLVIKIPGGDLSAAAPEGEQHKSSSRLGRKRSKSNCTRYKVRFPLSWSSRAVRAARAPTKKKKGH